MVMRIIIATLIWSAIITLGITGLVSFAPHTKMVQRFRKPKPLEKADLVKWQHEDWTKQWLQAGGQIHEIRDPDEAPLAPPMSTWNVRGRDYDTLYEIMSACPNCETPSKTNWAMCQPCSTLPVVRNILSRNKRLT